VLCVVSAVCCECCVLSRRGVTNRSLIQRSPTECCVSIECDRKGDPGPQGLSNHAKKNAGEYYQ